MSQHLPSPSRAGRTYNRLNKDGWCKAAKHLAILKELRPSMLLSWVFFQVSYSLFSLQGEQVCVCNLEVWRPTSSPTWQTQQHMGYATWCKDFGVRVADHALESFCPSPVAGLRGQWPSLSPLLLLPTWWPPRWRRHMTTQSWQLQNMCPYRCGRGNKKAIASEESQFHHKIEFFGDAPFLKKWDQLSQHPSFKFSHSNQS